VVALLRRAGAAPIDRVERSGGAAICWPSASTSGVFERRKLNHRHGLPTMSSEGITTANRQNCVAWTNSYSLVSVSTGGVNTITHRTRALHVRRSWKRRR